MKKALSILGIVTSLLSTAQINLSEGFESTNYPFTNTSFFRSSVIAPCVGTYGLNRNFWNGGTAGSTIYSSTASNGGKLDISFKYKTHIYNGGSVNGTLKVDYSVDGGQSYQTLETINLTSVISCTTWSGSIPQANVPSGSDFRFRVSGQWTSGDYWVVLDDFKLTQSPFLVVSDVNKKETEIYPNPFTSIIFINNPENVKSISISDVSGRAVKDIQQVSKELKLNDLKSGLYIISIHYKDGKSSTSKILKK
ncbi:MAG: hypothetical protein DI529_06175 [Chryseobacterium sp.]|nr:MAG: hypothetical protein DI529_06175 [Chryseobacterium sp.]